MDQEEVESPFLVSEDSKDEFLIDSDSDSDFGMLPRKRPGSGQICCGKRRVCVCCLLFVIASLVGIFVVGILIGHFGIPYHFESEGTSPPPTQVPTPPPCSTPPSIADEICTYPPVLLVSLDGFRASYFERNKTPFLESLAGEGVRADYMRSAYPTKTFPNHYSIVTGLYPESHGIVNNAFYDTLLKDKFYIGSPHMDQSKWWRGEPIWVTARKAGLVSGVYFWPGSEAKIEGLGPNYFYHYNSETSFEERVDTVLGWLDLPSNVRPQFLAMYLEEPDHSGHQGGPFSSVVDEALGRVDQAISRLYSGLEERRIKDCVNVVIVSDHGMALYNSSKLVDLSRYIPESVAGQVSVPTSGPVAYLETTGGPGVVQTVFDSLVSNSSQDPVRFFPTPLLPYRLHAGHQHTERYGDLQLLVDIGGYMVTNGGYEPLKGIHGYDNIFEEVHAIFLARGPAFKSGFSVEAFDNIQLYSLMCGLLGLSPAPNNGSTGSLYHILKPSLLSRLPEAQSFPADEQPSLTQRCSFPPNDSELLARSLCEKCVCMEGEELGCEGMSNETILEANRALDISDNTADMYKSTHLPWGIPSLVGLSPDTCLLAQEHYVSLYSQQFHLPLWTAYKLTREQVQPPPVQSSCFRRDPRLMPSNSAQCSNYSPPPSFTVNVSNITYTESTLLPVRLARGLSNVELEELADSLLSNVVPQDAWFSKNIWGPLQSIISDWADQYGAVHVLTGPVLDSDHDGVRDNQSEYGWWTNSMAVPTGYYVVLVKCGDEGMLPSMCSYDLLDAIGFLLQHPTAPGDRSSANVKDLLKLSLTHVRDIEKITGLNFFPLLTAQEQNKVELRIVNNIWPSNLS